MTQCSILLIDDDVVLLRQMATALGFAGFSVRCAVNGREGLRAFQAEPADLVVTDIIMPEREGIETIIALRAHAPRVKIIAMSGGFRIGPEDFLNMARHVGADAVIAKPFRLTALLDEARQLLAGQASGMAAAKAPGKAPGKAA
ncbi:MAG: response regulator [Proteobacteria bacterium]|nr:response regulator [Pseudomonadota bacterium]